MIQVNPEACARSEVFLAFINGLYTTLSQNFDDKMEIVFHYLRSDLINKLSNLAPEISSQFGPALPVFLESIKTDIEEISQLFNGEVFKCANVEDMVNELNRSSIGAIVTNLISIARNQPQVADRLYAFLYHFLLFYRKQLSDPSLSFEEAAFKSFDYATPQTEIEAPELPESSVVKNNTAYQYLNKEYKFVADGDFALMAKDFTEGEKQKEISQLREQLASLQQELNQTKEELFEAEQRAAAAQIGRTQAEQDEIANYKREIEAQIRSEVKTEVEKMREELENVKAENEKLRASQSIISELAAYIPDLKKIELKPLEVNQVLSPSKVDLNALLGQVAKIKADGNASDPNVSLILNTLEAQLRLLAEERSNNERNAEDAIQKVREDRVALTAEYNQIRDIQIKIINGLSSGKMYDIFNDDEQNAEDDENAPIDQSRIQPNTPPASGPTYNFPWIKLSDRQCLASKEWTSVCEHLPEVNAEEVQKYFAVHENPEGKLLSERTQKRLRHILTKTKMTPEAISRELNSQSFKLSEEILTLVFHLPLSPKEMESLAAFNGDVKTLDDAERLGILLYRIPEWRLKVEQSIELHRFDHDFTILMQNLDKISLALTQLKESTKLPILLAAVLALGNHLNGGTGYGGASGFSLSNLKDLKFIKSNIKGVSLLNYIAHTLIRNGFDLTELQAELNKLQPASRYTILDINEKLKNAQIMLAARPRDPFVRASSRRVYDALQKVNAVQREYYRILRVFGIREELLRPGSLIPLILDFTSDLSRALKENRTNGLESASSAVSTPTRTYQRHTSVPPTPPPMLQDDEKQRGILTKMVGALSQSSRVERNISESQQEMSEFQKAFAKVRKSVL
ncbi:hypothetical protein TRFO_10982 [Tritrichomonas foetus]|uniref:FH2 domain-containing protein n=1 Tax=Tritrichomonas foetus TaxID=1144522 RepID=A0A1J4J7I2_9EUKA|nr:hypothetical protein TRFO_10982 [Tritrichomonas foetus]|eukprot:OHS94609.1 hypothetical protein TRFO_10982 [Tritrichomonas foetus]